MASVNNFNVTELTDLQARAAAVFSSILENISTVRSECGEMSGIVASEDSALASRWDSVSTNMVKPIQTIDDTFLVVKTLLDTYVSDTIANEQAAQAELENIDEGINGLGDLASVLFDGLSALKGIGFGATAIAIPGLAFGAEGNGGGDGGYGPFHTDGGGSVGYGSMPAGDDGMGNRPLPAPVPGPADGVGHSGTGPSDSDGVGHSGTGPSPADGVGHSGTGPGPADGVGHGPMPDPGDGMGIGISDPGVTIKYAPPGMPAPDPGMTIKYAPPGMPFPDPGVTIKYAPPGVTIPEGPFPETKYAPPGVTIPEGPFPETKYAPPHMMGVDTKVKKGK